MSDFEFKSSGFTMRFNILGAASLGVLIVFAALKAYSTGVPWQFPTFLLAWGIYDVVFAVRTWGKNGDVAVDLDGLTVEQAGSVHHFGWHQVRECTRVRYGPLISWWQRSIYRLTYSNSDLVTYFVPGPNKPRP